jgi:uncharacterized protein YunC (DUF1805 family)
VINVVPITLENGTAIGVSVKYPKTTLLSIATSIGYVMCGVLNIDALDTLHPERQIIAARVTGVRQIEDLLEAKVSEVTKRAEEIGIQPGMTGKEALEKMLAFEKEG